MLDDVTHIVAKSSRNRYVCCNWGLLDLLLDLVPKINNEILFGMQNTSPNTFQIHLFEHTSENIL